MSATTMQQDRASRPLVLNDFLVDACLEGRKTQHRVPVRLPEQGGWELGMASNPAVKLGRITSPHPRRGRFGLFVHREIWPGACKYTVDLIPSPFGGEGDLLWVREAHALVPATAYRGSTGIIQTLDPEDPAQACVYRANFDRSRSFPWRSATQMPRWASRACLRVKSVWLENVQDIDNAGAEAEGARHFPDLPGTHPWGQDNRWSMYAPNSVDQCLGSARSAYGEYFCRTYGQTRRGVLDFSPWDRNWLVWVAEFELVEPEAKGKVA